MGTWRQLTVIQRRRKLWKERSYERSFATSRDLSPTLLGNISFDFSARNNISFNFCSSADADLYVLEGGALLAKPAVATEIRVMAVPSLFHSQTPNKMTPRSFRFGSCRGTTSPNLGLYFNSRIGLTVSHRSCLVLTSPALYGPLSPVWLRALGSLEVCLTQLISTASVRKRLCHFPHPWGGLLLPSSGFYKYVVPLFSLPYL